MRAVRTLLAVCLVACSPVLAQEDLTLDQVQGAWYGWLAGTGMEIKIAALPDGAVAYLKTVQGENAPFLQELSPSVEDGELLMKSTQAPQPFTMRVHFEGQILFGTYDDGYTPVTIALARAMPDVEELFEQPAMLPQQTPMQETRAEGRRAASAENLRRIGDVFRAFAENSQGNVYPPIAAAPGKLAPEPVTIYPRYLRDATLFIAPGHPDADALRALAEEDPLQAIDDSSYWYVGYLLPNEEAALAFANAYDRLQAGGNPIEWGEQITSGGVQLPRLRLGVERNLMQNPDNPAEAQAVRAQIPVLIERPGLHAGGSNVLFMDGHVEFLAFPGPFPMTQSFIESLIALDEPEPGDTNDG